VPIPDRPRRWLAASDLLVALGVTALYLLAAKLGLLFSVQAQQVSAIWPPTGLALAVTVKLGRRALPGVFLGAFLANVTTAEPAAVAAGIAVGNTLEAVAGASLLRWAGFDGALARVRDVLALLGAALVSPLVSAAIGTASLGLGGVQPGRLLPDLWWLWWLGDALGALVIAPVLFAWTSGEALPRRRGAAAEGAALLGGMLAASALFFAGRDPAARFSEYAFFPLLFWAALRFGPTATVTVTTAAYAAASLATHAGLGPFAGAGPERGLVLLQVFMAVSAATGLVLGAVSAQRRHAEESAHRRAEQLVQSDRRKNEFLAMLGHELRNPLAPILHAVDLLEGADSAIEGERWREVIRRQTRHLTRIVDDLLDIARITRGTVKIERRRIALGEVVAASLESSRPLAVARRQHLEVKLAERPLWVDADPTRLAQVVSNLLHNAVKFTPEGGRIELAASEDRGWIVVRVRDSGAGMTPEVLASAFELFAQGGAAPDRPQGGLGLGLTLVRQLVELHGGTVTAASEGSGRGSELVVRLPAAPAEGVFSPAVAPAPAAAAGSRRVLVVDDNADAAASLAELLRLDGHEVREATDGREALAQADEFRPEVVLLDLGLPGLDGWEVAAALRRRASGGRALLVAISGYGRSEDRARSLAAGIDLHLVKPVEPGRIRELVRDGGNSRRGVQSSPGPTPPDPDDPPGPTAQRG
jgi:signal transduction histidine kinase/CheY-like chemotaxis protein